MLMQTYNSIHNLPLFNFDRYLATKDLNWFFINYDGRQKKIESEELQAVEAFIMDEYYNELQDRQFEIKLQKWAKIDQLQLKYNTLTGVIFSFAYGFKNDKEGQELRMQYIQLLKGFKINIPVMNTPDGDVQELIKVKSQLENIKTQIKMIQDDLKIEGKTQQQSLYKQLRMISIALGQKDVSNPKEITVAQWVADCKLAKEISQQN
jgi:hypothetical protein